MTAEVGVHGGEAEVSIEEKRGVDLANGVAHKDADCSYVFVNGKDVIEEADLHCNVNGNRELESVDDGEIRHVAAVEDQNGSSPDLDYGIKKENGGSPVVEAEMHNPDNGVSNGGGEGLPDNEADIGVRADKDEEKDSIEHTVKDSLVDHEGEFEKNSRSVSSSEANGHSYTNEDELLHHSSENGVSETPIGSEIDSKPDSCFEANGVSSTNGGNEDDLLHHSSENGVSETAVGSEIDSKPDSCFEANGVSSTNGGNEDDLLHHGAEDGVSEAAIGSEINSESVSCFEANGGSSTNGGNEDDLIHHGGEDGVSETGVEVDLKAVSCNEANGHSSTNGCTEEDLLQHRAEDGGAETGNCTELVGSISSPEAHETLPLNVSAESVDDFATGDDSDKRVEVADEIPLEGASGDLVSELGDEVVKDSVLVESVEVLPDHQSLQEDSEIVIDEASKVGESPPFPLTNENGTLDTDINASVSTIEEHFPASSVDEVRTEAGVEKSEENAGEDSEPFDSSEVVDVIAENSSASVPAVDETRVEAEVGNSEENITESADSHLVDSSEVATEVPESTPPPVDEVSTESEVGSSEEKSRDIADYHSVNPTEATVEVAEIPPVLVADEMRINPEVEKSDEEVVEIAGANPPFVSEIEAEATESSADSSVDVVRTEIEVKSEEESKVNAETDLAESSEVNIDHLDNGPLPDSPTDLSASESKTSSDIAASQEIESSLQNPDASTEAEASNMHIESADSHPISVGNTGDQFTTADFVENDASLPASGISDLKEEIAAENISAETSEDIACDDIVATEPRKANGPVVYSGICAPNDGKLANIVFGQFSSIIEDKVCQKLEPPTVHKNDTTCSPEGSTVDNSEGKTPNPEVGKRQFFLMRLPRYDDENLKEQIRQADIKLKEKTQDRDTAQSEVRKQRAIFDEVSKAFNDSIAQERAARDLLNSKRQELDSLQSVVNIEDIDARIRNMEHKISHETLDLKEEKKLIREMKQLRKDRESLFSTQGRQDGVKPNPEQKLQVEERLKLLRKEEKTLRDDVRKAEAITKAAKEKRTKESDKLRKLQLEARVANDIRQEAYSRLHDLKKESYEKHSFFYKFRDDAKAAYDLASERNLAALEQLCDSQVERHMELWNTNPEYRNDYIRSNMRSTIWRLQTLDGRSLGPDEEPPVIPRVVVHDPTVKDVVTVPEPISTPSEVTKEELPPAEAEKAMENLLTKAVEEKVAPAKPKKPAKSSSPAKSYLGDEIDETKEAEPKKLKEEEELARKEEESRKAEEEARLQEQRRVEERAKAKEALERKKKNEEKAQARAAIKAQKEFEEKERERERKLRKKERRKMAAAGEGTTEAESAADTEAPTEPEAVEKPVTTIKKQKRAAPYTKQVIKAKSIPPPLRNRGKRRMQPWMWVLLTIAVIFAFILLGNSNFSFDFGLLLRRFK